MNKHTPTPYAVGTCTDHGIHIRGTGRSVGRVDVHSGNEADRAKADMTAEFIVRACNSHDALVAALTQATRALEVGATRSKGDTRGYLLGEMRKAAHAWAVAEGRAEPAALKAAKGAA